MKPIQLATGLAILLAACGTDFLFEEMRAPVDQTIPAPTGLVASYGAHMSLVRLSWKAHEDAVSYEVYKSNLEEGGAFTMIASNLTATAFDDTNTVASTPFFYKVSYTTSETNVSELSATAKGMSLPWRAPAPTGVSVIQGAATTSAIVSYAAGDASAKSFIVYTSSGTNDPYIPAATTAATSVQIDSLRAGQSCYIRVVGVDESGTASQVSAAVKYTVPPFTGIDTPGGLTASQGTSDTAVSLNWTTVTGATGYHIHRGSTKDGGYAEIGNASVNGYADTTAIAQNGYWYRITAYDATHTSLPTSAAGGFRKYGAWSGATIVTASDGTLTGGVLLSWLPAPGASKYNIEWCSTAAGSYITLADGVDGTGYFDTSPAAGEKRWYQVRAVRDDTAIGPYGTADCGFRGYENGPPMPTGVTGNYNTVWTHKVSWDAMPGAAKYRVYRADAYSGPYAQIAEETGTEYSKFSMADYADYYYRVCCVDASGHEGPWSTPVQSAPNTGVCAPESLSASQGTQAGKVTLSWSAAKGSTSVRLQRAPSPEGPWTQIGGDLGSGSTGYVDTINAGVFFYRVQAVNLIYTAGLSATVMGYPAPYAVLDPPASLEAVGQASGTEVALSWPEVNEAAGYHVYRSLTEDGMYADVSGLQTGTGWTDSGLTANTMYYYKIATQNPAGAIGALGGFRSVTTFLGKTRLPAPAAGLASDGTQNNAVAVLWAPVAGAVNYRVFRADNPDAVYLALGAAIAVPATVYFDMTPLPGSAWYRTAAYDADGDPGEFSPADEGFPKPVVVPSPPTEISASKGEFTNGVAVSWHPTADAAYYKVARAGKEDGSYVFVSPELTNASWIDTSAKGQLYYYKVAAFNSAGLSGRLSEGDNGYVALTDRDFLIAYDTTIASSHKKMTLMHKSGTGALGTEIKNGDLGGQVMYSAKLSGIGAKVVFTYIDYCDKYLVINGAYTVDAKMDESGTMTSDAIKATSPIYNGTVRYNLTVKDGNAAGGYWMVSQDGNPEVKIDWFASPSSLAVQ